MRKPCTILALYLTLSSVALALQQALGEHSDDVRSVAISPDGKWLASSSEDRTVKLWQLETMTPAKPR